jgi:hypothetical protein
LHNELEQDASLDASTSDMLRSTMTDIEGVLERPDSAPPAAGEPETMTGRLREATWELEESHPRLTSTLGQLIEALTAIFK